MVLNLSMTILDVQGNFKQICESMSLTDKPALLLGALSESTPVHQSHRHSADSIYMYFLLATPPPLTAASPEGLG